MNVTGVPAEGGPVLTGAAAAVGWVLSTQVFSPSVPATGPPFTGQGDGGFATKTFSAVDLPSAPGSGPVPHSYWFSGKVVGAGYRAGCGQF